MSIDQMDGASDTGEFHDDSWGPVESATTTPNITYINESGVRDELIEEYLGGRRGRSEIASVIEKWSQSLTGAPQVTLDLFNRHRWKNANHQHAIMSQTAWAVENDDILETLADVIEGLMWQKCRFELFDADEQSFWNQWARDVNLDAQLRKMGREEFKVSQFYVGLWWEKKVYEVQEDPIEETIKSFDEEREEKEYEERVRTRDEYVAANSNQPGFVEPPEVPPFEKKRPGRGNRRRKKKFPVKVPTAMTIFDPLKIVPVGNLMFGRERFAYVANRGEDKAFASVMRGEVADGTVLQLIERKYEPTEQDKQACADIGVDHNALWLLRSNAVFRHTATRADYERYAPVRLKPVLPILEMKQHLRASDRATLIGSTNFIVVITKGSDKLPARPAELANLQEQAKIIARIPVLIGDHRLKVEIIAPSIDHTLQQSRWEVLDSRLVFAALKSYSPVVQGGNSSGTGVSEMSRVISRGMESRRHMIIRDLEKHIFQKVLEENEGVLNESPSLAFTPKRISLDFNTDVVAQLLKLRDRGDISRETVLEEVDYDQEVEVVRRARERARYDSTFNSQTPHSSPAANPYGVAIPPQQQPNYQGNAPGAQPTNAPKSNVGPNGQPRTEGGRPPAKTEEEPRNRKGTGAKRK